MGREVSCRTRRLSLPVFATSVVSLVTLNGTLTIYNVTRHGIVERAEVSVGLEPVSLAQRNWHEV